MPDRIHLEKRSQEELKKAFLEQLELNGNISMSARKVKIARKSVYNWLEADEQFKKDFRLSAIIGLELIDDEIQKRAIHGTKKPVYQGGKRVGYVNELSDTLLIFYAKAKKPEVYKERFEHTGADGTPLAATPPIVNIYNSGPPLASSEEDINIDR